MPGVAEAAQAVSDAFKAAAAIPGKAKKVESNLTWLWVAIGVLLLTRSKR